MLKTILLSCFVLLTKQCYTQSLPANTCGVVYSYDAAGNRTERKYICNNGSLGNTQMKNTINFSNIQKVTRLYPNPTSGRITVEFTNALNNASIILTDMSGRTLQSTIKSGAQISLDLSSYPSGMYILQIKDNQTLFTQKVIKK
ncbi:T9SS type A sorting domain-containing protein [Rhizosphaericola mali]|uniref:T9SS type A sorting domain-containing protein n=1 Tax=Rhizosphaericola mali TaxID=2545455 RepID=A0A5P2G3J2_9BACT|nr:T9SS type A sorting domain-containing protein [Rhizosphaericola mali]QES88699.1 T9SS type A sorting domain-containing protein [Rhizosphaericola mali]